ncbi:MAG: heparan-alpha-glucosaminide N-acetyltransferase domain-containing protein [Bryobacteraceae bacterium]|nr:heparan-alpha-glucosaminide N-acetyltransferase domain-containing protein [Bryobacteraceae bacterium]
MQSPGTRYRAVDALRGLIMMIMAVDHAGAYIARQHGAEFWAGAMSYYTDAFPFLTRWITHLCAPGFFFLMGAGVYWSTASTALRSDAVRRTLWRGFVLFVTAQLLETPLIFLSNLQKPAAVRVNMITAPPPVDGTELYWGLIVLSALGLVTMVCALMLWLRPWAWLVISVLCVVATNSLLPESGKPGGLLMTVLLAPGISQHLIAIYPVIPWLAGAAAGMYFGYWWRKNPDDAGRRVWILGLTLLVIGIAVRAAGGWGNIRLPRDTGWIEFLNNVKYPPSLVFWTMSLGIDLLLLALLVRLPEFFKSDRSPLLVFGQTPLFFYVLHLYVLLGCGLLFFREASSLEVAWVVWAVALVALYPLCLWYRDFKLSKPKESVWRLF